MTYSSVSHEPVHHQEPVGGSESEGGLCFKLPGFVSGQEGEEEVTILDVLHLYYIVMVLLCICLSI